MVFISALPLRSLRLCGVGKLADKTITAETQRPQRKRRDLRRQGGFGL